MSQPPPAIRQPPSGSLALLVWLLIQLAALLVATTNTTLWARPSSPIERFALPIMVAFQSGSAALLFPWLIPNFRAILAVLGSALLFDQLAGILATNSAAEIAIAAAGCLTWLSGLAAWRGVLHAPGAQLLGVSAASTGTLGFASCIYACSEFGEGPIRLTNTLLGGVILGNLLIALAVLWIARILAPSYPQAVVDLSTPREQNRA
jgi:hypothetical protein